MSELEKINIYVSEKIARTIENDARFFEILKKDGVTINRNRFLNLMVDGYYTEYIRSCDAFRSAVERELEQTGMSSFEIKNVSESLLEAHLATNFATDSKQKSVVLSLRAVNDTETLIEDIVTTVSSPSAFFRNMLASYCELSLDKREQIIFRKQYDTIVRAIAQRKKIRFNTTRSPHIIHDVLPYHITASREEMFNYLLCQEKYDMFDTPSAATYRLSRIKSVHVSAAAGTFDEDVRKRLKRMERTNPKYAINSEEPIVARLTKRGFALYNRIYLDRPDPDDVNGDTMTFSCSENQIMQYFSKFANEVEIISPAHLRQAMLSYFESGAAIYKQ